MKYILTIMFGRLTKFRNVLLKGMQYFGINDPVTKSSVKYELRIIQMSRQEFNIEINCDGNIVLSMNDWPFTFSSFSEAKRIGKQYLSKFKQGKLPGRYFIQEDGSYSCKDENGNAHSYNDNPSNVDPFDGQRWSEHGKLHRLSGPAIIIYGFEEWYVNDEQITDEVINWIAENDMPSWKQWGAAEKTMFALRFR